MRYCPRCKSQLYPADEESMGLVQVCSYCTTFSKLHRDLFLQAKLLKEADDKKKGRKKNKK